MIKLFRPSRIITKDETFTVTREGEVIIKDAKPIKRDLMTFTVRGNIQPMGGRDLIMVPEGDRHKEQYWLFYNNKTIVLLHGQSIEADPAAIIVNDRMTRLGVNFQVQTVENWGTYSKARIMRIDVGPYAEGTS